MLAHDDGGGVADGDVLGGCALAVELVEGDPEDDDQGEMDVESRFFIRVDNE